MMDKFKDQEALQKAYESLEKEFTRRSQRLRELQGKIENRVLIELPCKVGTIVYYIASYEKKIGLFGKRKLCYSIMEFPFTLEMLDTYGKHWFLSYEEAEKKLKEIQE